MIKKAAALGLLASLAGCSAITPQIPATPQTPPAASASAPAAQSQAAAQTSANTTSGVPSIDPQIMSTLLGLFDNASSYSVTLTAADMQDPAMNDLLSLGSPIGYQLRNHYLNLGAPIAEALVMQQDPSFHDKLVTLARWTRDSETRAAALMALAHTRNESDLPYFKEALLSNDLGVRFGTIEALVLWDFPEAMDILKSEADNDPEPILKVYAAAQLARLGDPTGLPRLRVFLDDPSWLVQAMAARALGDYGTGDDYDLIDSRIPGAQGNNFVVAEYCIACIKLFPKKSQ